ALFERHRGISEFATVEQEPALRVVHAEREFGNGEPDIERICDKGAADERVEELEVLVGVEGQDGDGIAALETPRLDRLSEARDAPGSFQPGRGVAVMDGSGAVACDLHASRQSMRKLQNAGRPNSTPGSVSCHLAPCSCVLLVSSILAAERESGHG